MLGTVAIVWVTFIVGWPRRRLYYGLRAAAPLLTAPAGVRSDLELRHRGTVLTDPRVLTVELVSRGRKDIPNDAYNDREPLQLDVGARIVEILQVTSRPGTLPVPQVTVDGTSMKVGPSLIGKRHAISINVLTDGEEHSLTCHSVLIDVQVRQRSDERLTARRAALAYISALAFLVTTVASFMGLFRGQNFARQLSEIMLPAVTALFASALGFYFGSVRE